MKQLANVRKAVAGRDDTTLTRWIKEPGRHAKPSKVAPMPKDATRTRFLSRVIEPKDMKQVLVSGHSNVKIGRDVRKGHLKGYWIYTLSLEERATCPSSCLHWTNCFGNAMPFGKRVKHGPELCDRLDQEIGRLLAVRGRKGILIRLHALGDFYSTEYVRFWHEMLVKYPQLSVFGYTARHWFLDPIGADIDALKARHGKRFAIRYSNGQLGSDCAVSIPDASACPPDAFLCPEQTGKTLACATCAACWSTHKNVAFTDH